MITAISRKNLRLKCLVKRLKTWTYASVMFSSYKSTAYVRRAADSLTQHLLKKVHNLIPCECLLLGIPQCQNPGKSPMNRVDSVWIIWLPQGRQYINARHNIEKLRTNFPKSILLLGHIDCENIPNVIKHQPSHNNIGTPLDCPIAKLYFCKSFMYKLKYLRERWLPKVPSWHSRKVILSVMTSILIGRVQRKYPVQMQVVQRVVSDNVILYPLFITQMTSRAHVPDINETFWKDWCNWNVKWLFLELFQEGRYLRTGTTVKWG